MSFWKWSKTADSNDTADTSINWRENQAPRTVNNSARGMMAALAKYRDDVAGTLTTSGTSTAYEISSNQVITANTDGFKVAFSPHTACGASPTLAVDSQTAKPLRPISGTDFAAGDLKQGGLYTATYLSSTQEWIVEGWFNFLSAAGNPDLVAIEALAGTTGALRKTAANTWALDDGTTALIFEKDNSGTVLATGIMGDLQVPFACTITGATMLADTSGSAVVDVWKDTYANYPPTDADSITASAPITISSTTKATDTTLTGWTTSIAAGDCIRFNLDSVTSCTRLTIILKVKRFI